MNLEKQLVEIIKQSQDEKRLGDKRAEQFYNTVWAGKQYFHWVHVWIILVRHWDQNAP